MPDKVIRVVGLASSVLFDKKDPLNPVNRRISMIVMNKKAEEAARHDGGVVNPDGGADDVPANNTQAAVSGVAAEPTPAPAETPPLLAPAAH